MTPRRTGLLAGVFTALGFFAVATVLDFHPGRPIATRTDVFFQSDAGAIVHDAVTNFNGRARGIHPAVYPLWTAPLHRLAIALEPTVPALVTATYGSRILVNLASGLGIGVMVFVLRKRGCPAAHLGFFVVLLVTAPGNTLAAIPDHFGISLGVLAAAFGVFYSAGSPRLRAVGLLVLAVVAASVTITNVLFPLGLLLVLAVRELSLPRWMYFSSGLFAILALLAASVLYSARPDLRDRIGERVKLYLTWTLTREPVTAAAMAARGVIDSGSGSTPVIARNNIGRVPMLTYQAGPVYRVWPYDAVQSVGAAAWLILLVTGIVAAWRKDRAGISVLAAWCVWNAVFHTIWGDEYFLYTPHYAWAFLTMALLGWQRLPARGLVLLALPIVVANVITLWLYREMLQTINM